MSLTSLDRRFLTRLLKQKIISPGVEKAIENKVTEKGVSASDAVLELRLADEVTVFKNVARANGVEFLDLDQFTPEPETLELIPHDQAKRYKAIPIGLVEESLVFAVADVSNVLLLDELKAISSRPVQVVLATQGAIDRAFERLYSADGSLVTKPSSDGIQKADVASTALKSAPFISTDTVYEEAPEPGRADTLHPEKLSSHPTRIIEMGTVQQALDREIHKTRNMINRAERYAKRSGGSSSSAAIEKMVPQKVGVSSDVSKEFVEQLVRQAIDTALENVAEEVEFPPPSARQTRTRIRRQGVWLESMPYVPRFHTALIARLKELAGVPPEDKRHVECYFTLEGKAGDIPAIAVFTRTARGDRCLIRFPENIPLLTDPFAELDLDNDFAEEIESRFLSGKGGLLILTADQVRLTNRIYSSLLIKLTEKDRQALSLEWTLNRRLPSQITQVDCSDDTEMEDSLKAAMAEQPDLLGVSNISSAAMLKSVFQTAQKGIPTIACMTIDRGDLLPGMFKKAGIDEMVQEQVVVAHMHFIRFSKLCVECREVLDRKPRGVPGWAKGLIDGMLFKADGCPACHGTGRAGEAIIGDVYKLDDAEESGWKRAYEKRDLLKKMVDRGDIDVRDVI